jgi:putative spermidine/putrescine transport system substrate-binding protein
MVHRFGRVAWVLAALGALALGAGGAAEAAKPFEGEVIRLQTWGGLDGEMVQKHIAKPFEEATGAKVVMEFGWTAASVAKLRAQKNDPQLDVVMFDDIGVVTAGREGLLEPLDLRKIPGAADVPAHYVFDGKGIGFFTYQVAMVYNTAALKEAPRSWRILWEPRFKSKVMLPPIDSTSINKVLIMAAVLNGGSQTNIDPGFAALGRLKPNIHSLEKNTAVIAENLRGGEAVLVPWQPAYLKPYIDKGYPIAATIQLEEGIFSTPGCVSIVKGHRAKRPALDAFIDYALKPEAQEKIAREFWWGPTNRKARVAADLRHVVLPAEGGTAKVAPVDLDHFFQVKPVWLDRLNKVLLQ